MDPRVARGIARRGGQRNRFGERVIEHVGRVADAVPRWARTAAWLHDLLELTRISAAELRARGLTPVECLALELLTRTGQQPYDAYIRQIADTPGDGGRIARAVKLADLDDHFAHRLIPPEAPPYAWAHRYLLQRNVELASLVTAQAG